MIVLLVYGIGILGAIVLGAIFWARAVGSRRAYRCPACGTPVTTELMAATSCSTCGTPLP